MKLQGQVIVWHRWMGIGFCGLFLIWFVSGIVMMYARMPSLPVEQRLARLPALAGAPVKLTPFDAWRRSGEKGAWRAAALTTIAQRPAYRFQTAKGPVVVYADDGERMGVPGPTEARRSLESYLPAGAKYEWAPVLTRPDQWTVQRTYTDHLPLFHARAEDGAGTEIYLSGLTGEVILETNRLTRLGGWAGAIPHWIYLRVIRQFAEEWRLGVIWASLVGALMAVLGMVAGIWRYSPSRRYRFRETGPQASPYTGTKRWHHITGLVFGGLVVTFAVSGALSLNPGRWSTGSAPTADQMAPFVGGRVAPDRFGQLPAAGLLAAHKELEFVQVDGQPLVRAGRRLSRLDGSVYTPVGREELVARARAAAGGAAVESVELLTEYGTYYYDRKYRKPLPVLEVKLADAAGTWFYLDPATGLPVNRYEWTGRWERWLYHGLHSLDFPGLWQRRPLWDVVVIVASLGGVYVSWSGIVIGWERLRAKMRPKRRKTVTAPEPAVPVS